MVCKKLTPLVRYGGAETPAALIARARTAHAELFVTGAPQRTPARPHLAARTGADGDPSRGRARRYSWTQPDAARVARVAARGASAVLSPARARDRQVV